MWNVKFFEWSSRLDTAPNKNILLIFIPHLPICYIPIHSRSIFIWSEPVHLWPCVGGTRNFMSASLILGHLIYFVWNKCIKDIAHVRSYLLVLMHRGVHKQFLICEDYTVILLEKARKLFDKYARIELWLINVPTLPPVSKQIQI